MIALAVPIDRGARLVDALLLAAEVERIRDPRLSAAYTAGADEIGDALDACPIAPAYGPEIAAERSGGPVLRVVPS